MSAKVDLEVPAAGDALVAGTSSVLPSDEGLTERSCSQTAASFIISGKKKRKRMLKRM